MSDLRRALGLFAVVTAGVGMILGAGIYALIGIAAGVAGNGVWLSFLISAIIALLTGVSYAELSSRFKGNSGEFAYVSAALGRPLGLSIGLVMVLAGIVSAATVAIGFGGYAHAMIGLPLVIGALLLVVLMSISNWWGIRESSWLNIIATGIELLGLAIIIVIGIPYLGEVNLLDIPQGFGGVLSGAALVFFAFMGFESMIKLREETKSPERTIPLGILYAILITAVVYVVVAIAAVSVIPGTALAESAAPLASVAAVGLGPLAFIVVGIIALFSTANTVLMTMVTTSRMVYGIAEEKALPKAFSKVGMWRRTPWVAVLAVGGLTGAFALIGDLGFIAQVTNVLLFLVFAFVNVSVIILRYKLRQKKDQFVMPLNIGRFPILAVLGLLSSLGMLVFVILSFL